MTDAVRRGTGDQQAVGPMSDTSPVTTSASREPGGRAVRVALLAALALVGAVSVPAVASAAPGTVAPALGSGPLEPLAGSVTPVPAGTAVLGPAAPAATVTVEVSLKPRDPAALAAFAQDVSTPGSPRYHHYLPAGHLAEAFGPTAATLQATRAWLGSSGLSVGPTSADGLTVPVTGTTSQVESAFAVPLERARLADGRTVRLATANPSVPATLVPVLQGVLGLSDQAVAVPHLTRSVTPVTPAVTPVTPAVTPVSSATRVPASTADSRAIANATGPQPCAIAAGIANGGARTAADLASTYGLSSLYAQGRIGAGQSVGLFELENYSPSDIATYQACYGTHAAVLDTTVDGGATSAPQGEAALDIEVVAGLAPESTIHVYTGPNDGVNGPYDTYRRMVVDDVVSVISTSWGQCEALLGQSPSLSVAAQMAEQSLFQLAASQGQTVLAASGDAGSTDCYPVNGSTGAAVDDPAAQPYVTGVGGTTLTGISPGAPTELAWGAGHGGTSTSKAGGGGISSTFSGRQVPDVSASADPAHGDIIYWQGQWYTFGGTSMGSPLWAALVADIDQGCAKPVGWLNPQISGASTAFNDVTVGDNLLLGLDPATTTAYAATVGYDMATGWGSPKALALMGLLAGAGVGAGSDCPSVIGLSRTSGPANGGYPVVISGSSFGPSPSVTFGGVPVPIVGHDPAYTSLTVIAPGGPAGSVAVAVTRSTSKGAATSASSAASTFTYLVPQVSAVSPARGPSSGGGTVVIDGSGFTGVQGVYFGGTAAIFTVNADGTITAAVPPGAGGTVDVSVRTPAGTSPATASARFTYLVPGYWMVGTDGGIFAFGDAGFHGSAGGNVLTSSAVTVVPTPDDQGYWIITAAGAILPYGDAGFFGSLGGQRLNRPIVGMAATADGNGYWLVASDGGIFAFGDAGFHGSAGALILNRPIVGMSPTADGGGYWLVASDGGIFAFGDAPFHGSTGSFVLNRPIVGMAADLTGGGYWLVASDGGIFAFGDAPFFGSTGGIRLNRPIVGMAST